MKPVACGLGKATSQGVSKFSRYGAVRGSRGRYGPRKLFAKYFRVSRPSEIFTVRVLLGQLAASRAKTKSLSIYGTAAGRAKFSLSTFGLAGRRPSEIFAVLGGTGRYGAVRGGTGRYGAVRGGTRPGLLSPSILLLGGMRAPWNKNNNNEEENFGHLGPKGRSSPSPHSDI